MNLNRESGSATLVLIGALAIGLCSPTQGEEAEHTGSTVRVADDAGEPVKDAELRCVEPAGQPIATDEKGMALVVGPCASVSCRKQGYLSAKVRLPSVPPSGASVRPGARGGEPVACTLRRALLLEGQIAGAGCERDCSVALFSMRDPKKAVSTIAIEAPPAPAGQNPSEKDKPLSFRFPAVLPGKYRVEIARSKDGWTCGGDIGAFGPGKSLVAVAWREPVLLAGKVLDDKDQPVAKMTARAFSKETAQPANGPRAPAAARLAEWKCAGASLPSAETDAAGTFKLPVDPSREVLVVAGSWDDARGLAASSFKTPPSTSFVLRPVRPARVAARIAYEDDRPATCRARVKSSNEQASWLSKVLPGGPLEGSCDPKGKIAFGPFLPAAFRLQVSPARGLPLSQEEKAPAPGALVDLGVLRIDEGEMIRVLVADKPGAPVSGANVRAAGRAGIIVTAEAATDERGVAELVGLPRAARVTLDVEAVGFQKDHLDDLAIEDSPFTVVLESGARVSGRVMESTGAPVAQALVEISNELSHATDNAATDADGRFSFNSSPTGRVQLSAKAPGFRQPQPLTMDLAPDDQRENLELVLEPAAGIHGRVLDPSGKPVAGASVVIAPTLDLGSTRGGAPLASATTSADGSFVLSYEPEESQTVVATFPGLGPGIERSPLAKAGQQIEIHLSVPARLSITVKSTRARESLVTVKDGIDLGRVVSAAGRETFPVEDLAPGEGSVRLISGPIQKVTLVSGRTTEASLSSGTTMEGNVTLQGAPLPRAVVTAADVSQTRTSTEGPTAISDERGFYRIEGLEGGRRLMIASAPAGRSERWVDLPEEGSAIVDLAITPVVLNLTVTDKDSGLPVEGADIMLIPKTSEKQSGRSIGSSRMTFDSDDLVPDPGYEVTVSNCGCTVGKTDRAGRARITSAATGAHSLSIYAQAYQGWMSDIELRSGDNAVPIALTSRTPRKVHIQMLTDPAGLAGNLSCLSKSSSSSFGMVAVQADCPNMAAGKGEVLFAVPGYGSARSGVTVPETGEITVILEVKRGGTLVVPVSDPAAPTPGVVDAEGVDWSRLLRGGQVSKEEVPDIGLAWVFRDIPPGSYTAVVAGTRRPAVEVASGETAIAW